MTLNVHIALSDADVKALQQATRENDPRESLISWVKRAKRWRAARERVLAAYQPSPIAASRALAIATQIDRRERRMPIQTLGS